MSARQPPRSWTRAPMGLIGKNALIVTVEAWIAKHEKASFTTNVAASWSYSGREARRGAVGADVLCFGDSMVKFGLSPLVMEEKTGLAVFNLAPYGGPPSVSYLLLRRALEAGARPKALVVQVMPHVMAVPPSHYKRAYQELVDLRDALDLAWSSRSAGFFASLMLGRLVPSVRARDEVRESLRLALEGKCYTNSVAHYITPLWRNWRLNRGGELAPLRPDHDPRPNVHDRALFPPGWSPDPITARYMRRFFDLASERGIPVYWLLSPISPGSQDHRGRLGLDSFYTEMVRKVRSKYPNVLVVDARKSRFPDDAFIDMVHLNWRGASVLSADLAEVMRRHPNGPEGDRTWVELPPFGPRPVTTPLEDLDRSRVVLKERAEGRR
jgi:hypothetical protein